MKARSRKLARWSFGAALIGSGCGGEPTTIDLPDGPMTGADANGGDGAISDGGAGSVDGMPDAFDPGDCGQDSSCLVWPMPGVDTRDWVINNYVDLEGGGGTRDYTGATGALAKTYDGHNGVDINVGSFRQMDGGYVVHAAAAGVVEQVIEQYEDRHTSCANFDANVVVVRHSDGTSAIYAHFKQNSVVVSVGQTIAPGDPLGVVGSSGCSTHPHLHFELRSAGNAVIDPFLNGLWGTPPPYDTALGVMDFVITDGAQASINPDPAPNDLVQSPGVVGFGVITGGGPAGQSFQLTVEGPVDSTFTITPSTDLRWAYWITNPNLSQPGTYALSVAQNGALLGTIDVTIE